jgi:hypothetical protein
MPMPKRQTPPESVVPKLKTAAHAAVAEVAPGKYVPTGKTMPDYTIASFIPDSNGQTFSLKPVLENMVRVDSTVLASIGMKGMRLTLHRLGRAGFIEVVKISPRSSLLNLDSWYNHVRRCAEEGEEFWTPARVAEYLRAL